MDIDTQDELLVEYDDGDAPMREDEGDAEMLEGGADDNDDTPMLEDEVIVITEQVLVEETEIVMQPAEEEDDVDTPMREDEPSAITMDTVTSAPTPIPTTPADPTWPPQPTDVSPVPSLLPSALSVPQETRPEGGKIPLSETPQNDEPTSIVAEPTADMDRPDDATSQVVEPAMSVRESEFGTNIGPGTTAPPSAAPSVVDNVEQQQQQETGVTTSEQGKDNWPPAPTEVSAVPSLLPSALAVPEPAAGEGVVRADGGEKGSVVADDGSVALGGEKPSQKVESLEKGKEYQEENPAAGAVPVVVGQAPADPDLVPIVLSINGTHHRTLFSPLPSGTKYLVPDANGEERDLTDAVGEPLLSGMAVDVFRAPLSEVFQGLRDALVEWDPDFSVKRGKELVLDVPELELSVGEDNKHAGEITLHEIVQLYRDCNGVPPMVIHVLHDSPRFFEKYKMIRAMVDAQRGTHDVDEYEEHEDELVEEGEVDEGETVYVDAQEDDLALDEEYEFADDEDVTYDEPRVQVEEDELAQEPTELGDAASIGDPDTSHVDPAAPNRGGATDDIVEYEEDEIVILDTPGVVAGDTIDLTDELDTADGADHFGVEATIRAAEQQSARDGEQRAASPAGGAEERTTPGKRPREMDDEQQQGGEERQVKRKLSVAAEDSVATNAGGPDVADEEERGKAV